MVFAAKTFFACFSGCHFWRQRFHESPTSSFKDEHSFLKPRDPGKRRYEIRVTRVYLKYKKWVGAIVV